MEAFQEKFLQWWTGEPQPFEVALAVDLSSDDSMARRPLYDAIGDLCDRLGHRAFRPYVTLGFDAEYYAEPHEVYTTINRVVIPNVSLVLACLDLPSTDVGMMMEKANQIRKDVVYFFERGKEAVIKADLGPNRVGFPYAIVKYRRREDLLDGLEQELLAYFQPSSA